MHIVDKFDDYGEKGVACHCAAAHANQHTIMSRRSVIDPTAEKLRSKHIRTLEAFQKVVNENKELKSKLRLLGADPDAEIGNNAHLEELRGLLQAAESRVETLEVERDTIEARHSVQIEELDQKWTSRFTQLQRRLDGAGRDHEREVKALKEQVTNQSRELFKLRQALQEQPAQQPPPPPSPPPPSQVANASCSVDFPSPTEEVLKRKVAKLEADVRAQQVAAAEEIMHITRRVEEGESRVVQLAQKAAAWMAQQAEAQRSAQTALRAPSGAQANSQIKRLKDEIGRLRAGLEASNKERELAIADAKMWAGRAANEQSVVNRLKDMLRKAQDELAALSQQQSRPSGSKFAEHVKLGRENQALRQQVEALKQERKKFVQRLRKGKVVL